MVTKIFFVWLCYFFLNLISFQRKLNQSFYETFAKFRQQFYWTIIKRFSSNKNGLAYWNKHVKAELEFFYIKQ